MPARRASFRDTPNGGRRLRVLLPLPLAGAYDYMAPAGAEICAGDFVRVPLGRRETVGVVWDDAGPTAASGVDAARLRPVGERLDCPPMSRELRRLIDWLAEYTLSPPGAVLRMAMSVPEALTPPAPAVGYEAVMGHPVDLAPEKGGPRLTPARRRVLALLAEGRPRAAVDLAEAAGVGSGVVRAMAKAGLLRTVDLPRALPFAPPDTDRAGPALSGHQGVAAAALRAHSGSDAGFAVAVLDGVTGAGKTEVYFEAIAETLRHGRQVLVLLPEIALGAQWLERFTARFAVAPAVWHSDLGAARRRLTWRAVADGAATVVVGARSALFLPFRNLGLIVIDEEHDPAFKQEEGVIYNARDMAVVRARLGKIPAVLVSATPSLETVANVQAGRYELLHLPERHGGARLPDIEAVDMRAQPPARGTFLSPPLRAALTETLGESEQSLLFLNRRGYAPLTLCRACGYRLHCPHCTAWLVEHRHIHRLQCHHCGHQMGLPRHCPSCEAEAPFTACGPGVERLAEELAAFLPEARIEVMSSDTMTSPHSAEALIRRFQDHEIDILIGTQMVAKGHHFPRLTLVGVIDADLGLAGGDLRALERTYQLLHQVAGRAGRAQRPGRVLLQTFEPANPVMQALIDGDRDGFLAAQMAARRDAAMPPFGRLGALILSGLDGQEVETAAHALARVAPRVEGVRVFGPAPAPLALLRGRHRWRFLIKASRKVRIQPLIRAWLTAGALPRSVRVQIDIDPYSFL